MMNPSSINNRRQFLKSMAAATSVAIASPLFGGRTPARFLHGVASGDPLHDRVIIWTRATPDYPGGQVLVNWEIAEDQHFRDMVAQDITYTDASIDYTVKIDAQSLQAGKQYFYRFICDSTVSPVGKTRTLPLGTLDQVSLAVFSCSNYPAGYFNVYREAAKQAKDLDFALHLGDYIYEYGKNGFASADAEALGRVVDPITETLTLADYRKRYAQYRSDEDLQFIHNELPFIAVWDDHEITNDTWREGAENHNDGEDDFFKRKAQALQAYYEWMPIRETSSREQIFRRFDFGDLLSLYMLDTRLIGRDQQLAYQNYITITGLNIEQFSADLNNPDRQLLGKNQFDWLTRGLQQSTASWQVLGQQVLMNKLQLPAPLLLQQISLDDYLFLILKAQIIPQLLSAEEQAMLAASSIPFNLDAWDGYPAAREAVFAAAIASGKNLISLAGDTHHAWASNLTSLNGDAVGVEFATPSVSSPGLESFLPMINSDVLAGILTQFIESLEYANTQHRGFMKLTLSHTEALSEWVFVDTVKSRDYQVLDERTKRLKVLLGAGNFQIVEA